jgi:uncharacterized protein (DUF362 family)/NAD-dependent dihydropyrimidine dehydrogenase PreA subunit
LKPISIKDNLLEKVAIEVCNSYDVKLIKTLLHSMFQEISFFPISNAKVLIKPNLLMSKTPEQAVTTHPVIIRALAELLKDYSCSISVGDSPGFGSAVKVLTSSGIMNVIKQLRLNISTFEHNIIKKIDGISPYREFVFGDDPEKYDLVINVPKLKTHGMMGMTLGVKNTFGFIHALEKAKWHLRAGQDRSLFASILIDIHTIVHPSVTVLDGIVGMDGNGPSSGRSRKLGLLGASKNAFILDDCIEKLVHIPYPTPISHLADKYGLLPNYEIKGSTITKIDDFLLPDTIDTDWNIPHFAKRLLKNVFTKKPKVRKKMCQSCGVCVKVCPANALSMQKNGPSFDYARCIRCYCCQEMCPEGAIKT